MPFQRERSSDRGWIATELALPERVADHRARRSATRPVVFLRERPADKRWYTQDTEKLSIDEQTFRQGALDSSSEFIDKPFRPETLALKVRSVLDKGR